MKWKKLFMKEALLHAKERRIVDVLERFCGYPSDAANTGGDFIDFDDGSVLYCCSDWASYDSGTFDEPPEYWLYN